MSLSGWDDARSLYLTRGDEVSPFRPFFTGDVFSGVSIPGVPDVGYAIVIAHPCSMRTGSKLNDSMLAATIRPHDPVPTHQWMEGFFNRMPLPELHGEGTPVFHVAWLEEIGSLSTQNIADGDGKRIACLSPLGVNILQQRLVFNLTRLEIGTSKFWDAFSHTYEESDLLEEWTEGLDGMDTSPATSFDIWIREGSPSRQSRLRDTQHRSQIRSELRAELRRIREARMT